MKDKLQRGEFVVVAEIEPPKGVDVSGMVTNVSRIKGLVDACVVPEMSSAVMRMSSLGGAVLLQGLGMPSIMQVNCRDRNRLALQADILAAYSCGVRDLMAVTGDEPKFGDHPQAKAVYDLEFFDLLRTLQKLQSGRDMAGIELQGAPSFLLGSTINPYVDNDARDQEVQDFNAKSDLGVRFFVTPPMFDLQAVNPFLEAAPEQKSRIFPTVLLIKSLGMARYIVRNLPHLSLPDELLTRIKKAADKERECIAIAAETIVTLKRAGFGGIVISTMGWEHKIPQILEATRE